MIDGNTTDICVYVMYLRVVYISCRKWGLCNVRLHYFDIHHSVSYTNWQFRERLHCILSRDDILPQRLFSLHEGW